MAEEINNTPQIGGTHYHEGIRTSPWDLMKDLDSSGDFFVDYCRGDIIAYVSRLKGDWQNIAQDFRKAAHFALEAANHIEKTKPNAVRNHST